jgi:YHS domain-containing protein
MTRREALLLISVFADVAYPAFAQRRRTERVRDPVCGLMVDKDPELSVAYRGITYFFCTRADAKSFRKNPRQYIGP